MSPEEIIIDRENNRPILMDVRGPRGGETVIFCHGYKGYKDWGCWNLMADFLADQNVCVVKFNFSCNGGTMANPIDFPDLEAFGENNYSREVQDLVDVVNAVEQELGFTSINLVGHSRGGGIVALVAQSDPRIGKVISWAGVSDYGSRFPKDKYLEHWQEKEVYYVKNGRTGQDMPHYYQFFEDFEQNKDKLNIQKAVSGLNIPHLIVHGTEDEAVNVNEAYNLKKWNKAAKLHLIMGAGHTFGAKQPWEESEMPTDFQEAVQCTLSFIQE